ncbi:hypothetical protein Lal_00031194 [Lupinus albus]|nr:hypothetical protein Lal_00031194 [Lupinus albus]
MSKSSYSRIGVACCSLFENQRKQKGEFMSSGFKLEVDLFWCGGFFWRLSHTKIFNPISLFKSGSHMIHDILETLLRIFVSILVLSHFLV